MSSSKPPEILRQVGDVLGMKPERLEAVWDGIVGNNGRLETCEGPHDFQEVREGRRPPKARCSKCGGEVRLIEARWYERAMKHVQSDIGRQIDELWKAVEKHVPDGKEETAYAIIEGLKRAYQATGKAWEPKK